MPEPKIEPDKHRRIVALHKQGLASRDIAQSVGVGLATVNKYRHIPPPRETRIEADKKVGKMDFDQWCDYLQDGQKLKRQASYSQDYAKITLGDGKRPVALA